MSINNVIISGNLTRDAELRELANGNAVLNFSVAVNDRYYDSDAEEYADYANFVDCTLFGNRAKALESYLTKGSKVAISGKLHYSSWEKDGQKRSRIEVTVSEIEFLSGNGESDYHADKKPTRKRYNQR